MIVDPNNYIKQLDELKFSIPENTRSSGRLLVAGGSPQGFNQVIDSFSLAFQLGAGRSVLCLPDNLLKFMPRPHLENISFLPSVNTGSFSKDALPDLLNLSAGSDALFLPGQLGRSSETAQTILSLIKKLSRPIVMAGDSVLFLQNEAEILEMPNIYLFLNLSLVQRLMGKLELIKFNYLPTVIEEKLQVIASRISINFCFILSGWLYAVFGGNVYRLKLKDVGDDQLDLRKNRNSSDFSSGERKLVLSERDEASSLRRLRKKQFYPVEWNLGIVIFA